jgi:hypothetical protein
MGTGYSFGEMKMFCNLEVVIAQHYEGIRWDIFNGKLYDRRVSI